MLGIDQTTALRQIGVVITNDVYDSVQIPYHREEEEMNQSQKRFKKLAINLAIIIAVVTPLAVVFHRQHNQVFSVYKLHTIIFANLKQFYKLRPIKVANLNKFSNLGSHLNKVHGHELYSAVRNPRINGKYHGS